MKKRGNEKVMLIAETNWLESIALAQDSTSGVEIMFDSSACVERIRE